VTFARLPTDEALAEACRFEAYRASGPGGQKRNKTSSAVRVTHGPTGLSATAADSRSQHRNRAMALKRLRHKLALECRMPVELTALSLPAELLLRNGRVQLDVPRGAEGYLGVMAFVLDVLAAAGWSVSSAAEAIGVSTGQLVSFLRNDEKLWTHVNRQRAAAGLRPLVGQ
jgi:hypothetical protein